MLNDAALLLKLLLVACSVIGFLALTLATFAIWYFRKYVLGELEQLRRESRNHGNGIVELRTFRAGDKAELNLMRRELRSGINGRR